MQKKKTKVNEHQKFLEERHAKLVTGLNLIEKIVKQVTGFSVRSLTRIVRGEVNEVYKAETDGKYNVVVRISRREHPGFYAEEWVFSQCAAYNIPVPKVLFLDKVKNKGEFVTICIENEMEGDIVADLKNSNKLTDKQLKELIRKAGSVLAKIHKISPSKFGGINGDGVGHYDNWSDFLFR